tara:strand:+ start:943 stop:1305 length:363 start_codon:yes stop_codon:yes gene_type:complete
MALSQTDRLILGDSIDDVDVFVAERSRNPDFVLADFIEFKKQILLKKYEIEEADMTIAFLNGINVATEENKAWRASIAYRQDRAREYPPLQDQLDDIFHNGLDGWRADIQAVKDKYPKPK